MEKWVNFALSNLAIGLVAYQAALTTGASEKSAIIAGLIAACAAGQGHFRQNPLEIQSNAPSANPSLSKPSDSH